MGAWRSISSLRTCSPTSTLHRTRTCSSDRNFSVGLVFIFIVGIILLATMALLPPFMQNLLGYPVIDAGYLLAPRGIGTMFAMMLVGG